MKKTDKIVVRNASGRRQFIRAGAGLLLGGSTIARAQEEESFRTDCDGQGFAGEKNAEVAGNDTDSGPTADRPGCGRKKPAVMTEYRKKAPQAAAVRVTRVKV